MGCDKRIIITTFASNVHRLQQIIDVAAKYGRKVAITGRSMENVLHVASVLGYVKIPENVMVDLEKVNSLPREKRSLSPPAARARLCPRSTAWLSPSISR